VSDSKSSVYNRSLGTSLPDAVRIELARLNRAHVRETNQAKCDEIEAKIRAIEVEYYTKAKATPKRTKTPPPPEKPAPKPTEKPQPKRSPKQPTKPQPKNAPKQRKARA
jgi:hypothetical protein